MLKINKISFSNFLTYGDYITELSIKNLGSTLIVGENQDSENPDDSSNACGKTSLLTAILWCLFGRTINNPSPGNKVINWNTNGKCFVKITTDDGWSITRSRNFDGHNELLIEQNGKDETRSTNENADKFIKSKFNLNFDIFTNSVYFGQIADSFLGLPEQKRKKILEVIFGIDKLNFVSEIANEKLKVVDTKQEIINGKITTIKNNIKWNEEQIISASTNKQKFEKLKESRINSIKIDIDECIKLKKDINLPDIDELNNQWNTINKIKKIIKEQDLIRNSTKEKHLNLKNEYKYISGTIESDKRNLNNFDIPDLDEIVRLEKENSGFKSRQSKIQNGIEEINGKLSSIKHSINTISIDYEKWSEFEDSCPHCDQKIDGEFKDDKLKSIQIHLSSYKSDVEKLTSDRDVLIAELKSINFHKIDISSSKISDILKQREILNNNIIFKEKQLNLMLDEINNLSLEYDKVNSKIVKTESKMLENYPKFTLEQYNNMKYRYDTIDDKIQSFNKTIVKILEEENPYDKIENEHNDNILKLKSEISELETKFNELNVYDKHVKYIKNVYSDRKKLKSFIVSDLIPFFNNRIKFYLECFAIEFDVKFTSSLSVETSIWGYDFFSGGEKRRVDLSIMFALYDLYNSIYGQQSNLMVLDEIEGSLDFAGVQQFVNVINNKVETNKELDAVFIISHKKEMIDAFPNKLKIAKQNSFSRIEQI